MNTSGWLIERNDLGRPHWMRVEMYNERGAVIWTDDANVAIRFGRKEDALHFWFLHTQPAILPTITEHVFIDRTAP